MKIERFTNKKKQTPYWVAEAENDREKRYLMDTVRHGVDGWKPSVLGRNKEVKFYTYDAFLADNAKEAHMVITKLMQETEESEGEEVSESEVNTATVQELRKEAATKAKAEGKPTTDLRTKWTRAQLTAYINHGTWVDTGNSPAPDMAAFDEGRVREIAREELDEGRVNRLIKAAIDGNTRRFEVIIPGKGITPAGIQHFMFPTICKIIAAREHFMLVGPAGSGKTHASNSAATAMSLKFYCISVGQQTTKTDLLGFVDATGKYNRTQLRDAVEFGGVFLLDEADAGNANTMTVLNAILSNSIAAFPDGMITVHEDFVCICAMNTYGRGADRQYVGRNQLDAASLDRFAVVDFDYDEELERLLTGNDQWVKRVQSFRKAAFDLKERMVISPRASYKGAKLLRAGFKQDEVENMIIWKGVSADIKTKISNAAQSAMKWAA